MITKTESNNEYHSHQNISASGLKTIFKKSVYHYLNKVPFTSKSLNLGSAVHAVMLEGMDVFNNEFYVMPKLDARTKEGKTLKSEHIAKAAGKNTITKQEWDIIEGIMSNFQDNKMAQFYCDGQVELSHYSEYKGVPIRVRPDCFNSEYLFISDVKTCQDNSPRAFKNDIYKYSYHLQAVCYSIILGYPIKNFRFIAVETNYPYSIKLYSLGDDLIEQGIKAFESAISDWSFYLKTGIANKYRGEINENDDSIIL